MTNDTMTEPKLANAFASSHTETVDALKERFKGLNQSACEWAALVSTTYESLSELWSALLPSLAEMHSFLSQRGTAREGLREAGLPVWTAWLKTFQRETGLNVSMRAVQKHLAKFRGIGKEKRQRQERPIKLSGRDQKRLLTAAQCGTELVAALENGGAFHDALKEYKRIAMDSNYIGKLLESLPTDTNGSAVLMMPPPPVATKSVQATTPPTVSPQPLSMSQRLPMPKRGDWSGLFHNVDDICGMRIKAALDGLGPEAMADVFGRFIQKLAKTYCHLDNQAVKIQVKVDLVKYNA